MRHLWASVLAFGSVACSVKLDFTPPATDSGVISLTDGGDGGATATRLVFANKVSPAVAGVANNITVAAEDNNGDTVSSYTGTVYFSSSDPLATLPTPAALVNGSLTFTGLILRTVGAAPQTVTATDGTLTTGAVPFTVIPAGTSTLTLSGTSPTVAGVAQTVTVVALDSNGNVDTNDYGQVTFSSSDPAAVLPAAGPLDAGMAMFPGLTLKTAGSQTVTATVGSISSGAVPFTVTPAAATKLGFTSLTNPVIAGSAHTITVAAQDPYGNTDPTNSGTVSFSSSDSAATLPNSHALSSGVYTFSGLTFRTLGTQTLTATDGSLTSGPVAFSVTPVPATQLLLNGNFSAPEIDGGCPDWSIFDSTIVTESLYSVDGGYNVCEMSGDDPSNVAQLSPTVNPVPRGIPGNVYCVSAWIYNYTCENSSLELLETVDGGWQSSTASVLEDCDGAFELTNYRTSRALLGSGPVTVGVTKPSGTSDSLYAGSIVLWISPDGGCHEF